MRLHRRKQFHKQRLVQLFRELRRSTAALPDGVIILSTQREIVWFNRQAARLLGLKRPMDLGLRIDNLIRSPEFVRYLHGDDFALPLIIRPPVQLDLYLALQVVPYGGGQSLLLVRDVTRQMRLEAMRKDFVANASHELRTPLDRDFRLPRHPGGRPLDRPRLGRPDPRHAGAGAAHERHHRGSFGAVAAGVHAMARRRASPIDVPRMLERLHRDALAGAERPRHVSLDLRVG